MGPSMFITLGMGCVMVLGGVDLSAGRVAGLTACVSASLLQLPIAEYSEKMFPGLAPPPFIVVILIAMAIGAAIGALNGFCVVKFKVHPYIVTLAMQLVVYGITLWYVSLCGNEGHPIAGLTDEYKQFVKGTIHIGDINEIGFYIPYYVFYAAIAIVIMWFIWNRTALGKKMFAVGADPEAARASGVSVMGTTVMVFALAGVLFGLAGFIEAARSGSNSPTTGLNMEYGPILVCLIGGASLKGGSGKISGIIVGTLMYHIISWWLMFIYQFETGILLLVFAAFSTRKEWLRIKLPNRSI